MKKNDKNFCRKLKCDSHCGGMLMELMLALALAAITIPFVVRYQKNAIERARNVAVIKQMDMVRGALERCILQKRTELLTVVNGHVFTEDNTNPEEIDCLILKTEGENKYGLINYGLTEEFASDYKNDYKIRITKTADNNNQAVLHGVVLLTNGDINAMRTREIVNLGGGTVGFVDGDYVRGGFNSFQTQKSDFGLTGVSSGLVQTTDTTRGDLKYLWRLPSENPDHATMLSFLNLDGHDIVNVSGITAIDAAFDNGLTISSGSVDIENLKFMQFVTLDGVNYLAPEAYVNGVLYSNDKVLNVANDFSIAPVVECAPGNENCDGDGMWVNNFTLNYSGCNSADECEKPVLTINGNLNLAKCETEYEDGKPVQTCNNVAISAKKATVGNSMYLKVLYTEKLQADKMKTPLLKIDHGLISDKEGTGEKFYIGANKASLYDIDLMVQGYGYTTFNDMVKSVVLKEEGQYGTRCQVADGAYGLFSKEFCEDCIQTGDPKYTTKHYLEKLEKIREKIALKYTCAKCKSDPAKLNACVACGQGHGWQTEEFNKNCSEYYIICH